MLAIDEALHQGGVGIKPSNQFQLVLELLEIPPMDVEYCLLEFLQTTISILRLWT